MKESCLFCHLSRVYWNIESFAIPTSFLKSSPSICGRCHVIITGSDNLAERFSASLLPGLVPHAGCSVLQREGVRWCMDSLKAGLAEVFRTAKQAL